MRPLVAQVVPVCVEEAPALGVTDGPVLPVETRIRPEDPGPGPAGGQGLHLLNGPATDRLPVVGEDPRKEASPAVVTGEQVAEVERVARAQDRDLGDEDDAPGGALELLHEGLEAPAEALEVVVVPLVDHEDDVGAPLAEPPPARGLELPRGDRQAEPLPVDRAAEHG